MEAIVQQRLKDVEKNQDFSKAASALYGMSFDDFIDLFIRPVAERELLDGKLLVEKTTVDAWLKDAKARASVTMFIPNYSWQDGKIKKN